MKLVTIAWVMQLLTAMEPSAAWKDTYPKTAEAFADVANEEPLYPGEDGAAKTAALYTAIAWYESTFNPVAVGDHGHSVCLGQINDSNFSWLGVTREQMLTDQHVCARAMKVMVKTSFRVCKDAPKDDLLTWYAAGGSGCSTDPLPRAKARNRLWKAQWLFKKHRPEGADFLANAVEQR